MEQNGWYYLSVSSRVANILKNIVIKPWLLIGLTFVSENAILDNVSHLGSSATRYRRLVALHLQRVIESQMATKLYVGGLSYSTTDVGLADAFAKAGNVVSAKVIIDKMTGRSKGFGFVEMSNEDEARAAIEMYEGKEIDGRRVRVSEARPEERKFAPKRDNY
ncbi:MAG: RNA-binding protein [Candidatus Paceibacterota bacterium]|jgi:hypothetical protein